MDLGSLRCDFQVVLPVDLQDKGVRDGHRAEI